MALVSPTVIVVLVMVVLPVLWALILSFQRIRLLQIRRLDLLGGEYTLRNYDLLFSSSDFFSAIRVTLLYSVFGTAGRDLARADRRAAGAQAVPRPRPRARRDAAAVGGARGGDHVHLAGDALAAARAS